MKKHLLIIFSLLIIVLFISCSEESKERKLKSDGGIQIEVPDIQVNGPNETGNVFEYTSNSFFFSKLNVLNGYDYSDDREDWINKVETRFGIKLKILSSYEITSRGAGNIQYGTIGYYNAIKNGIDNGDIVGMYPVYDFETLKVLKEGEYILPLNNFINEGDNWKSLPSEWRNVYSIDGLIWAIPKTYIDNVTLRYIRSDWLKNLEIPMPETINEFYEAMYQFTYNDPDMDNLDNTIGTSYLDLYSISDLFSSFDARLNYQGKAIPTWNPNTNIWEDSILKSEFADCMLFIQKCVDEKIMGIVNEMPTNNRFFQGYMGSSFSIDTRDILAKTYIMENRPNNGEPEIDYIMGLSHYINKNITSYYTQYYYPIVLTKSSTSPASTVNILINDFLSDYEGFMLANRGLQDVSYAIINDMVVGKTREENGTYYSYEIPNIISKSPLFNVQYASELHTPEVYESWQTHNRRIQLTEGNDLCYKIPYTILYNNSTAKMEQSLEFLSSVSSNIVSNVIKGNLSFEDGVNNYRDMAKQLGIQEFLDEQNELLGKTSTQHY